MKKAVYILTLMFSMALPACISEYTHPGVAGKGNILVVEGIITEGTTTIKLSRSLDLSSKQVATPKISTAEVAVVCEDGTVFTADGNVIGGVYNIPIDRLDTEKKYHLRILVNKLTYVSEARFPQPTPAIDNVNFYKAGAGEPVEMRVSAKAGDDESRFYLWSYDEIWEETAVLYSDLYIDEYGSPQPMMPEGPGPYYYCWHYGSSKGFILGSTAKQKVNELRNYTIFENDAKGDKFRICYWYKLRQNMIAKDAYDYFATLQKNAEESGSIFAPVLSEMPGNITCLDDESVPVIGFVEVSLTSTVENLVDPASAYLNDPPEPRLVCKTWPSFKHAFDEDGIAPERLTYVLYNEMNVSFRECVDCRSRQGTKVKPAFWPNDHY